MWEYFCKNWGIKKKSNLICNKNAGKLRENFKKIWKFLERFDEILYTYWWN